MNNVLQKSRTQSTASAKPGRLCHVSYEHTNTEQQKSGLVAEVRESDNRKIIDRSFQ